MADKFQNKYRIQSARLQHWDYGSNASYFVTICTKGRIHYFGEVINGEMVLNDVGKIVEMEWLKTFEMRPDMNLTMGEYMVMPNHFHAIIGIGDNEYNFQRGVQQGMQQGSDGISNRITNRITDCRDAMHCVSTVGNTVNTDNPIGTNQPVGINDPIGTNKPNAPIGHNSSPAINENPKNQFGPQSKNLASIIRGFKIGVTINGRLINPDFGWQPRFHDHIIRNDESFNNISNYIKNNPANWKEDKFY